MLARIFCRSYGRSFDVVVGTVSIGLFGVIIFNAFTAYQQGRCNRQPENLENSLLFVRSQAAYYEENGEFAKDFERLALVTLSGKQQTETKNSYYRIYRS